MKFSAGGLVAFIITIAAKSWIGAPATTVDPVQPVTEMKIRDANTITV